jgi:Fe-S cluster biogenesis protein NfuA
MSGRLARLEEWLATLARPVLATDGGDVKLVSVDEREIVVRLSAACAGCPGAGYTMTHVVEPVLRAAWMSTGEPETSMPAVHVERAP